MKFHLACFAQLLSFLGSPLLSDGHSWIEKLEGPHGEGMSRIGMGNKDDSILIRYFCPYDEIEECQPDPKHGIDLTDLPPGNGDPRRPCRANLVSDPKTPTKAGDDILISWAGNGHVNNGQSEGTCVQVMIAPFTQDPSYDEFIHVPGAECLDYWIFSEGTGAPEPEGVITIPEDLEPGTYTLFWVWNFTEFWYSSCADIDVLSENEGTRRPTQSPIYEGPGNDEIQDYLESGCSDLENPDRFCKLYSGLGPESRCENEVKDDCGRSSCEGLDRDLLFECPPCGPSPGCSAPETFYDDFSNGIDSDKWLVAHKSWGNPKDGSFKNGGVVHDNVYAREGNVILEAHGSLYTGDVMGVEKDYYGNIVRMQTGVRTGAAIATRKYFGAGSYEIRMKIADKLGVCSAFWTFFYNEDDHNSNGGPIINHEIDIELPGRPDAPLSDIGFDKALLNTWVGEIDSLYTVNYTQLNSAVDDGQFHTWRFDWHTDESNRRVEFFLDGEHLATNTEHVPFYAGRVWIGAWFPNKWAGDPNFDVAEMEVDYFMFTPFENEIYECPDESYPNFGWAPGTEFGQEAQVTDRCKQTPSPLPAPQTPVPTPSQTPPSGNPTEAQLLYIENGCQELASTFCSLKTPGSYCKDWNSDECDRSICQGDDYEMLSPCETDPSNELLYAEYGCTGLPPDFCGTIFAGSYCKDWQSDHCSRSICQGDDFSSLHPC